MADDARHAKSVKVSVWTALAVLLFVPGVLVLVPCILDHINSEVAAVVLSVSYIILHWVVVVLIARATPCGKHAKYVEEDGADEAGIRNKP